MGMPCLVVALAAGFGLQDSGWTREGASPVVTAGAAGSFDDAGAQFASVLPLGGGGYRMWYDAPSNAGAVRIATATSADGVAWTKGGVVLSPGLPGSWDDTFTGDPSVVADGGGFRMAYWGMNAGGVDAIGIATSADGVTWTKLATNPVLTLGAGGAFDGARMFWPCLLRDGAAWYLWYTGVDAGNVSRIGLATSSNGNAWAKSPANPVLAPGAGGAWDGGSVFLPRAIRDGVLFRMWYTGTGASAAGRIGYAESLDGTVWTRSGAPLLAPGPGWDSAFVWSGAVLKEAMEYRMWYTGTNGGPTAIGLASAPLPGPPPASGPSSSESSGAGDCSMSAGSDPVSWRLPLGTLAGLALLTSHLLLRGRASGFAL